MNRKKLLKAVESTAGTAAEKGQAAFDEAADAKAETRSARDDAEAAIRSHL